jgi:hypothetical protein
MPFIRLCDNYTDHPKFTALSDAAFRLWHEGMAHCRRYLTDGFISDAALKGLRSHSKRTAEQLCAPHREGHQALWSRVAGGVHVHDYLEWNASREEENRRTAGARERTSRWRRDVSRDASQHASSDALVPDRIGEVQDLQVSRSEGEKGSRFDRFWAHYPRKIGKDAARRAFERRKPTEELLAQMLAALEQQCSTEQWQRDGGQYIPHPSTWLNQGRWQDDVRVDLPTKPSMSSRLQRIAQMERELGVES